MSVSFNRHGAFLSSLSSLSESISSSSSSSLSSSSTSPSSLRLVALNQVEDAVSAQVKTKYSFEKFFERISSFSGEFSFSKFNPCLEQMDMLTSMQSAVDISSSIATNEKEIAENIKVNLDIDQCVFCSNGLDPLIFEKVFNTMTEALIPPNPVRRNDFYSMVHSDATLFVTAIETLEPFSFGASRQTLLGTATNQLRETLQDDGVVIDDATRVVDLLNEILPHEHLVGYSRLDAVLKSIRSYNSKSRSNFDQFHNGLTEKYTLIDFGSNSDAPFRIAILGTVSEVRQAVKDIVSAWSKRKYNANSHGSTSAEQVCDSLQHWGSAKKFVVTSMKLQSLQIAVAILVLGRNQRSGSLPNDEIKIICESFNQKSNSHDASIQM